jgi:DNA mismatch endonuclease (patch repair protein)
MVKPNIKGKNASTDIFSKAKRSKIMASIKSRDTGLEKRVMRELRKRGVKFRTYSKDVTGKPDIAVVSKKRAIFIDSNFWHGWRYPTWTHKLRSKFWTNKIQSNRKRDRKVNRLLRKQGWKLLRVWEHSLDKDFLGAVKNIVKFLNSNT